MAFDALPFAVNDAASPIAVGIGATVNSTGCTPVPQTGAMGLLVDLSGTVDGTFDLIVQTGLSDTASGDYVNLISTRLNSVTGVQQVQIPFVDPILDRVRVQIIRTGGTGGAVAGVRWLADRATPTSP